MREARKTLNELGWRYTVFAVVVLGMQLAASYLLRKYALELLTEKTAYVQYALTVVTMYVVGFPLIYFLTKGLPVKWEKPDQKMGTGRYLMGICICYLIVFCGSLIGNLVHMILAGTNESVLSDLLMTKETYWIGIVVVGICAPVFEELIFRKFLIDHLAHRGKLLAVITSGLLFGLFHGNFSQFFYAAGLGIFFAIIYVKTGKIRYTIGYHMIVNLVSSVVTTKLAGKYMEDVAAGNLMGQGMLLMAAYGLALICLAIMGLVFFIVFFKEWKLSEDGTPEESVRGGDSFKVFFQSIGMWMFMIVCGVMFTRYYVIQRSSADGDSTRGLQQVTDFRFEVEALIEDGVVDPKHTQVPFILNEDGSYYFNIEWKNEPDEGSRKAEDGAPAFSQEPGYLTAMDVRNENGDVYLSITASTLQMQSSPVEMEAGEYVANFYYYSKEDEVKEYLESVGEGTDYNWDNFFWDTFGVDGEDRVNYHFQILK